MERSVLRCLAGSALTAAVLTGCAGRSPFTDGFETGPSPGVTAPRTALPAASAPPGAGADAADRPLDLPVLDAGATLDDYLRYAALKNPGLEAAFRDWQAAVERVPQVRALPDPRFTYGYYLAEVETRAGPMQHALSLSQTLPWFGTLGAREDAAARRANAAWRRFESARLALFERVEKAYNELFYLRQSIDITADSIELLEQFEQVARTRYRVAAAGHPDLIRIQVELGTVEDRLRRLRDLRAPYAARLNAALDRPADTGIPWPASVSDRVADASSDVLLARLVRNNPELMALQEEIEGERLGSEIARKEGLPDLTVGLAWTVIGPRQDAAVADNGDDAVLATSSINVPLWRDKYDAAVREAVARRLAAAARRGEALNRLTSDLQEALFEHHDARRRVELYRDTLIPKASEALQASLGAFAQGQSDFLDLLDTQRTLLEFQLALERARVDRATSCARLERLAGASLADPDAAPAPENTP